MKLYILRDQAKGLMGGVKFELKARAELTQEESGLVKNYKADKEVLLKKEIKIPLMSKAFVLNLTIGNLISGQTFKCNDIGEVIAYEESVKKPAAHSKVTLKS